MLGGESASNAGDKAQRSMEVNSLDPEFRKRDLHAMRQAEVLRDVTEYRRPVAVVAEHSELFAECWSKQWTRNLVIAEYFGGIAKAINCWRRKKVVGRFCRFKNKHRPRTTPRRIGQVAAQLGSATETRSKRSPIADIDAADFNCTD